MKLTTGLECDKNLPLAIVIVPPAIVRDPVYAGLTHPGGGGSGEAPGFFRDYHFKKANFEKVIFEIREVCIRD